MVKPTKSGNSRQAGKSVVKNRKITTKPPKPYADFPLTAHPSGHWAKKIRGKLHYFGKWGKRTNGKLERIEGDGWQAAIEDYKAKADDLHAGRTPRVKSDGLTVRQLCNKFHKAKERRRDAGEITARTFAEYEATTDRIVAAFGKERLVDDLAADDFEKLRAEIAQQWGPTRLGNEIVRVKSVFKYGYEAGLLERPVRYGPEFTKPSKSAMRRHRAKKGERMMGAADVRTLIDAAPVPLKAMVLLGINCGFGNHDCALLPLSAVDLKSGWVVFPRPKSGVLRRCPLWPETIAALNDAIKERHEPTTDDATDKVFTTTRGRPWLCRGTANPVSVMVRDLMKSAGVHGAGLGFYTLRHVFRTVADAARDVPATRLIMGHADGSMDDVYRERIDDERLVAVVEHVRGWLFGEGGAV